MPGETTRITLLVARALEQIGIPYAVGGSLASSVHGVMRSTLDVDIVADMRHEHIAPLVAALSKEFYADDEMMRDAIEHHSSFNLIHYETAFKVDIFIRKLRAFDQMQAGRIALSQHQRFGLTPSVSRVSHLYRDVDFITSIPNRGQALKAMPFWKVSEITGKSFFWARTIKVPYLSKDEAENLAKELKEYLEKST